MDSTVIYSIYKATNIINGKSYIGFTNDFIKRKRNHKTESKKYDYVFYRALRKYGWDNFHWEILYQSKELEHTKNFMETYFIKEYRTYTGFLDCKGYNETLGGEGANSKLITESNKKRWSDPENRKRHSTIMREKYNTPQYKEKNSQRQKNNWNNAEYRQKMILSKGKKFIVIDPNGNEYEIQNLASFCRSKGLTASCMASIISGRQTQHKGWVCKRA